MKLIDKRKIIGTVIGLIFFISCLAYFTYAWYEWRSGNNTVNLTIKDSSVECTNGPSIEVKNIGPILSLKDGVKANFNIKNTGGEEINITLGLNITSISSSLRTDSFKWALLQDTTGTNNFDYSKNPLLSGNFSNLGIKENTLSSTIKVAGNKTYSFVLVVYIDGNMENSESMMSGSMKATITYGDCGTINEPLILPASLTKVPIGSYVKYTGTNGCSGKSCKGQNANYVDSSNMGYCFSDAKFNASGWRVAYINDGTAYLTSGGSPECMCTNSSGNASTSCSDYESTVGVPKHLTNLNTKALTYCNSTYAYGGVCNSSSAWNMSDGDFQKITGDTLSTAYDMDDGYYDDYAIINNGGVYWFASPDSASSTSAFGWIPYNRRVISISSDYAFGVRPVLRLQSSVIVTGGTGTYEDPYIINNGVTRLAEVEPGSYVKYTGTNGCSGKSCEGQNANYTSTDKGYCVDSDSQFNTSGWRIAYISNDTAYLTSGGSPECMCTDSSGNASTSCSDNETTVGVPNHLANLNAKALTYCNSTYAYGGVCNSSSAWNMKDEDFQKITGDTLSTAYDNYRDHYNDFSIINNGGSYWFTSFPASAPSPFAFLWYANIDIVSYDFSRRAYGVRPVLRLKSSVIVTGGTGTYEDPYTISPDSTK